MARSKMLGANFHCYIAKSLNLGLTSLNFYLDPKIIIRIIIKIIISLGLVPVISSRDGKVSLLHIIAITYYTPTHAISIM